MDKLEQRLCREIYEILADFSLETGSKVTSGEVAEQAVKASKYAALVFKASRPSVAEKE